MAANGQGYVLAASDGGIFNYGTQGFFGSVPGSLSPRPAFGGPHRVGIAVTQSGNGYWLVGADGGVFSYGDAPFLGSIYTARPGQKLTAPLSGSSTWVRRPPEAGRPRSVVTVTGQ